MWVLACVLLDNSSLITCDWIWISHVDFYYPRNREIYKSINALRKKKCAIEPITLISEIWDSLDDLWWTDYIYDLYSYVLSPSWCQDYATIVKEKSIYRALINSANKIIQKSMDWTWVDEILSDVKRMSDLALVTKGKWQDYAEAIWEYVMNLWASNWLICNYWYKIMDAKMVWYKPWQLIVVWARPAIWKSMYAMNLADKIIKQETKDQKYNVLFFSLEMSNREISERILCKRSWIDNRSINKQESLDRIMEVANDNIIREDSIILYDNIHSFEEIVTEIRKRHIKEWVSVVIIDYLQLMRSRRVWNRNEIIWEMTWELKRVAQELQIAIILLSQLSRQWDWRSWEPVVSNLRDSWSIEQDADVVMLLYKWDSEYTPEWKKYLKIILAKQRWWESWIFFYLWVDAARMNIYDVDQDSEETRQL